MSLTNKATTDNSNGSSSEESGLPPPRNPFTDARVLAPLLLHVLLHKASASALFPGIKTLTKKQHLFVEKIPSTVNAVLVSVPVIKLLAWDRPWKSGNWLVPYPDLLDRVFAAHFAFTAYDLGVMAFVEGEHPSVWLHHVVALTSPSFRLLESGRSTGNRIHEKNAEKVALSDILPPNALTSLQTPLLITRCVLFTIFRFLTGPACIFYAVRGEEGRTFKEKLINFWKRFRRLPLLVSALTVFNIAALSGLNAWWTVLVYKALFRHLKAGRAGGVLGGSTGIHHI
ncbi:hypothetical protein HDU67_006891 [Dinochytrium kinnereticum]|nr:hypothetical protein HDU67_006891 [Dinochytrium kinnereticum]